MNSDIIKEVAEKVGRWRDLRCCNRLNLNALPCEYERERNTSWPSCRHYITDELNVTKNGYEFAYCSYLEIYPPLLATACKAWIAGQTAELQHRFAHALLEIVRQRVHPTTQMHEAFIICTPEDYINAFHKAFCKGGE